MKFKSRRGGFTLIEMVVVIGIIACLFGLFMPALTHAQEQARRVQCLNNVRQLTAAWVNYAMDNMNHTCYNSANRPDSTYKPGWIGLPWGSDGVHIGALWPYLNNEKIYVCPSDSSVNNTKTSYAMNGSLPSGGRMDSIEVPAKTFVFIEACNHNVILNTAFSTPVYPASRWGRDFPGENHRGISRFSDGAILSFADGHAIFWQFSDQATGNLIEASWGGPNFGFYNSPDVYQLEAWSGGPIPPMAVQ